MTKQGADILHDVSKKAFIIPQILLKMINMWPRKENCSIKITFYLMLVLLIILEAGQIMFFILNMNNLTVLVSTMSTMSTTFLAIVKLSVIFMNSKKLLELIEIAYKDFWPCDFYSESLKKSLRFTVVMVIGNMYSVMGSALVFAFGFLTKPLIEGTMVFPFESWYPINLQISPYYELIYILEIFVNIFVVITSILAHDYFFLALSTNVISQYKLLKKVIGKLGSGEDEKFNEILNGFHGVEKSNMDESASKRLLVKCIMHHNKLLKVCSVMEYIFSPSLFIQLATSVTAICVSSFLITIVEIDRTQLFHLTSYCLGHILQLFLICCAGNELSYQSRSFGSYAFNNNWYSRHIYIRKSLIMVIRRSQRGSKMTALGVVDLNYATFVAVMRLSFSFYTLLSNVIEKRKGIGMGE